MSVKVAAECGYDTVMYCEAPQGVVALYSLLPEDVALACYLPRGNIVLDHQGGGRCLFCNSVECTNLKGNLSDALATVLN